MLDYSVFIPHLVLARAANANAVFYSLGNKKAIIPFDDVAQANGRRPRHAGTRGASTDSNLDFLNYRQTKRKPSRFA